MKKKSKITVLITGRFVTVRNGHTSIIAGPRLPKVAVRRNLRLVKGGQL